jgi:hypothetical protein
MRLRTSLCARGDHGVQSLAPNAQVRPDGDTTTRTSTLPPSLHHCTPHGDSFNSHNGGDQTGRRGAGSLGKSGHRNNCAQNIGHGTGALTSGNNAQNECESEHNQRCSVRKATRKIVQAKNISPLPTVSADQCALVLRSYSVTARCCHGGWARWHAARSRCLRHVWCFC